MTRPAARTSELGRARTDRSANSGGDIGSDGRQATSTECRRCVSRKLRLCAYVVSPARKRHLRETQWRPQGNTTFVSCRTAAANAVDSQPIEPLHVWEESVAKSTEIHLRRPSWRRRSNSADRRAGVSRRPSPG